MGQRSFKKSNSAVTPVIHSIGPSLAWSIATSAWLRKRLFVVGGGRLKRRGLIRRELGRLDEYCRRVCDSGGGVKGK